LLSKSTRHVREPNYLESLSYSSIHINPAMSNKVERP